MTGDELRGLAERMRRSCRRSFPKSASGLQWTTG